MKFNVAAIQFRPELNNPVANIAALRPLLHSADGCQLVVLPELANSGYNFQSFDEALVCSEIIGHAGIYQEFLLAQAREKHLYIVSGINEREGDKLYNSAVLVGPEGILGKYRKMHLFMNEKDIFEPGDAGLPVFELGGFKAGMMICFDYLFPEPWRIMAQKGADIVCHPSNLLTENAQRCLPGISLMNRIYVVTSNRTGTERGLTFNGTSMFTDPSGRIISKASVDQNETIIAEIDTQISGNKMITPRNHAFGDRRPEAYIS